MPSVLSVVALLGGLACREAKKFRACRSAVRSRPLLVARLRICRRGYGSGLAISGRPTDWPAPQILSSHAIESAILTRRHDDFQGENVTGSLDLRG